MNFIDWMKDIAERGILGLFPKPAGETYQLHIYPRKGYVVTINDVRVGENPKEVAAEALGMSVEELEEYNVLKTVEGNDVVLGKPSVFG